MKIFRYTLIASIVSGVVGVYNDSNYYAFIASGCPGDGNLIFNSTNIDFLLACTQWNYYCYNPNPNNSTTDVGGDLEIYNSTTGPAPSQCDPFDYRLYVNTTANGSLSIPGLGSLIQVVIEGTGTRHNLSSLNQSQVLDPEVPLNLTSVALPDLVNVTGGIFMEYLHELETLSFPKLKAVGAEMNIDLSGYNPPSINLSFPSLVSVYEDIWILGNIDAIEFPVLNSSFTVNVTSTGNLNCTAFAASVVNTTVKIIPSLWTTNDSVICKSKTGSVTTFNELKLSGGNAGFRVGTDVLVLMGVLGLFSLVV